MKAIYVRQSIVKDDSISLDMQIEHCKKKLNTNDRFKIYKDQKSGKDTNRAGYKKMESDIKEGLIDTVIVYKVDRISRSTYDFGNIMRMFEKHKVQFISTTEDFDTTTPMGNMMLQLIMIFANMERDTIQKRINDNYYARAKLGRYLGGKPPFGYGKKKILMDDKKTSIYVENLEESDLVKSIFKKYSSENASFGIIAQWVNNGTNYATSRGNKWSSNTISRIIRNPAYTFSTAEVYLYLKEKGYIMNNDIEDFTGENGMYWYTPGGRENKKNEDNPSETSITITPHTPFIDAETWLTCQKKADKNFQVKNSGKGKHSWLSGLMKCGYCGLAATVALREKGNHKLICNGKKRHTCDGIATNIGLTEVENVVEERLLNYMKTHIADSLREASESKSLSNYEYNNLYIELEKVNQQIDNLVDAVATAGASVAKHYNTRIQRLEGIREKLTNDIIKSKISSSKTISVEEFQDFVDSWNSLEFDRKKEIAHLVIKRVNIVDDKIEVIFN
jgi:DNA invertase Pin-like site-specific DNA recombinase